MERDNCIATIDPIITACEQAQIKQLEIEIKQLNKKIDSLDKQSQDKSMLDSLLIRLDNLILELVATECMWHQKVAGTGVA